MGQEIDLLRNYPKSKRNLDARALEKTDEHRRIARRFDKDFFDGDRAVGYGGFNYNPRFWEPVAPTFREHFALSKSDSLLDVGCAKGFMLHDFSRMIPGLHVAGIDISSYAIENAVPEVKRFLQVHDCSQPFPYEDKSFDVVVSINTVHNLERDQCAFALQEIERVSRRGSFITVDAYRDAEEQKRMMAWNLTAKTIMHVDEWKKFFADIGYTGDYYWFIP